MSRTIQASDQFTALPDEQTLAETVVALHDRGFTVEVVDDLHAARRAVLARIPQGACVMTNSSITLQETGIASAIDESGLYQSARNRIAALDRDTQQQEIKAIAGQPDFSLGSVHAITRDGVLFIASTTGSQMAPHAYGAANVILVVGAQKLVPDAQTARTRIFQHSLKLSQARAHELYGQPSFVGKLLEIRRESSAGRMHLVLIRAPVGF